MHAAAVLNCTLAGHLLTPLTYNPGLKTEWLPAEELLQEVHQLAVAQLPLGASSLVGPQSCPALPRVAAQRRPRAAARHCTLEAAQSLAPAHTPCPHWAAAALLEDLRPAQHSSADAAPLTEQP